jgi:choline kinase
MERIKQCLILARAMVLVCGPSLQPPQTLVEFQGRPILGAHRTRAQERGSKFVIVLGIAARSATGLGAARRGPLHLGGESGLPQENGVSALKARTALRDNFLLLMADHLFEPETARMMVRQRLAPGEVILGVDPDLDRIYDIDDATKVRRRGDRIVDIGKEIEEYDAIDTGMFLCTPALFEDLDHASIDGNCSLSDGMRRLASGGRLRALEIDAPWHDLDTPEAFAHAGKESLLYAA